MLPVRGVGATIFGMLGVDFSLRMRVPYPTDDAFPMVRRPLELASRPVLVSIPHYGTLPVPGVGASDYADPSYVSFPLGYTDRFAADIYGNLDGAGATVLATPYSRLFVDVNRARDDLSATDGVVASHKGVVRTHTIYDDVVFAQPLGIETVERRLRRFYDPYHHALETLLDELCSAHASVLLVDAHTASERGLGDREIVVGTARGNTARDHVAEQAADICRVAGFRTERDTKGYSGGHIVRSYGRSRTPQVDAVQIEINTALLMSVSRKEMFEYVNRGENPPLNESTADKLKACVNQFIREYD